MNFTDDYLDQAQVIIEKLFRSKREELLKASGSAAEEFKDDKSVVTAFDRAMEQQLREALMPLDQAIGFEGEEFGAEGSRTTFWLADPIDGTESFVRGLPFFRNMITLIDDGKPVFCVVYRVTGDELFVARRGQGTYRNGEKLIVSERPLHRMRIDLATRWDQPGVGAVAAALKPVVENLRSPDEFLYVVEAKLDAHLVYKSDCKTWDNAPRMLLLAETGARVGNLGKLHADTFDYCDSNWLAAHPAVFDDLVAVIQKAEKST